MQRKTAKQRTEGKHDECEKRKPRKGTYRCRAPTSNRGDREHNRQCFDRFDKRAQEGGCDRWCAVVQMLIGSALGTYDAVVGTPTTRACSGMRIEFLRNSEVRQTVKSLRLSLDGGLPFCFPK